MTAAGGATLGDPGVPEALARRLLSGSPLAELAHLVLAAVVAGMLYRAVSWPYLAAWSTVVLVSVAGRELWRRRALERGFSPSRIRKELRWWVAWSGATWGVGTWWLSAHAPFRLVALMLVVLAGLVAGGMVTLMADRPAFFILTGCLLVPPAVGILSVGSDHDHVSAVILILVFAGFEAIVHGRAYQALVGHVSMEELALRQYQELQESLGRVKVLSGLLPICAHCKKIKDAAGTWHPMESYVRERSEAEFSHGLCPDCLRLYDG